MKNNYLNKKLAGERIAEFDYSPGKCDRTYRVVVLHKEVHLSRGQMRLFDKEEPVYFFYITNATKSSKSTRQARRAVQLFSEDDEANRVCWQHECGTRICALIEFRFFEISRSRLRWHFEQRRAFDRGGQRQSLGLVCAVHEKQPRFVVVGCGETLRAIGQVSDPANMRGSIGGFGEQEMKLVTRQFHNLFLIRIPVKRSKTLLVDLVQTSKLKHVPVFDEIAVRGCEKLQFCASVFPFV